MFRKITVPLIITFHYVSRDFVQKIKDPLSRAFHSVSRDFTI